MSPRALSFLALAAWLSLPTCPAADVTKSLSQDVYVWQRDWNQPVREALAEHASNFQEIIALKADVTWRKGQPQLAQVALDYAALRNANVPVGLALRVGPYPGPFSSDNKAAVFLTGLASAMIAEAKAGGLKPCELQVDFDCASSKLDGYRVWVEAIRPTIAPVPLTITALPDWLDQPAFGRLAAATDGYVLQVHSLHAPVSADAPFTLCDPAAGRRAVDRAGGFTVPFRVALPTYGYLVAFDHSGKFAGLSAEGPNRNWPPDVQVREVRTDPLEIARLVQIWMDHRPTAMRGFIWYRLPVADDSLNLRWPTLAAMMAGHLPREQVHAAVRRVEPGLVEISLVNDGELDISSRLAVEVRWQNARMVAGDGLGGFDLADDGPSAARFQTDNNDRRLPAGEKRIIGWLRLSEDREVRCEIKKG
jgi:hypothetical protein